jgi:hypothetical protein
MNSALPKMVLPVAAETRSSRIIGVLPMASMMLLETCMTALSARSDPN